MHLLRYLAYPSDGNFLDVSSQNCSLMKERYKEIKERELVEGMKTKRADRIFKIGFG